METEVEQLEENISGDKPKSHKKPNIIVLGMTGSGKSSLGRMLALQIGYGFLDLDEWIEKKAGKAISQIFADKGEQEFRRLESSYVQGISSIKNHVISLGGGTLDKEENYQILKDIGCMVWIDCPIEEIIYRFNRSELGLDTRPLISDLKGEEDLKVRDAMLKERLSTLLKKRVTTYEQADVIFNNSYSTIEAGTCSLKEILYQKGIIKYKSPSYSTL